MALHERHGDTGMILLTEGFNELQLESPAPTGGRTNVLAFNLLLATESILNPGATPYWDNANNVCQVSGFKAKPGSLIRRWDNLMVLPEFSEKRHEQDFVRVRGEHLTGSIRPESPDKFISAAVLASDL